MYIEGFSIIAEPLYALTRKGAQPEFPFEEGGEEMESFKKLKRRLQEPPALRPLVYGDLHWPPMLTVDAGPSGEGGMITQKDLGGKVFAVRFARDSFEAGLLVIFVCLYLFRGSDDWYSRGVTGNRIWTLLDDVPEVAGVKKSLHNNGEVDPILVPVSPKAPVACKRPPI
ncbi:hypothetical protein HDU67_004479 [Dinochytrium kinnereticum]|nr:hypothetical protein HDU67_004479 [Dinochytrium kinnereticum]